MSNGKEMLTPSQVATRLGLTLGTVRRLSEDGVLPCVRHGAAGHRRYPADRILQLTNPPTSDVAAAVIASATGISRGEVQRVLEAQLAYIRTHVLGGDT